MFGFVNALKNRKGFTLIELLVVLAVLAIIALIAVPNFIGIKDKARHNSDDATIDTIQRALELAVVSEDIANPAAATTILTLNHGSNITVGSVTRLGSTVLDDYIDLGSSLQEDTTSIVFTLNTDGTITHTTH